MEAPTQQGRLRLSFRAYPIGTDLEGTIVLRAENDVLAVFMKLLGY